MNTIQQITEDSLLALGLEAAKKNDNKTVKLVVAALSGDKAAIKKCTELHVAKLEELRKRQTRKAKIKNFLDLLLIWSVAVGCIIIAIIGITKIPDLLTSPNTLHNVLGVVLIFSSIFWIWIGAQPLLDRYDQTTSSKRERK